MHIFFYRYSNGFEAILGVKSDSIFHNLLNQTYGIHLFFWMAKSLLSQNVIPTMKET